MTPSVEATVSGVDAAFARDVGARLRDVRRQHGLSLQQVSDRSGGAFSPSILGAYERGERALSVGRLSALGDVYGIPVWLLLPPPPPEAVAPAPAAEPAQVTLDLPRLTGDGEDDWDLIRRHAASVQRQRGDLNGHVLSLRQDDLKVLASLYAVPVEQMLERLRADGILR